MTNLDSVLKSRDITLPTRVHIGKAMVFPAMVFTDVRVGPELMPSNQGVVKTLESPWAARKSNQSTLKENQPWIFFEMTDAEAPILWPPDVKSWLTGKTLMLRKIEGRRRRGWRGEMVGWHHRLNGYEFEQTLGDGEGQGTLVCYSPWVAKSPTQWLNKNSTHTHMYIGLAEKFIQVFSLRRSKNPNEFFGQPNIYICHFLL